MSAQKYTEVHRRTYTGTDYTEVLHSAQKYIEVHKSAEKSTEVHKRAQKFP